MSRCHRRWSLRAIRLASGLVALAIVAIGSAGTASAESYVPISGGGSTWAANAITQFGRDVNQFGITVNYASEGSSAGRREFLNGSVDFAASDIPFQLQVDSGSPPENPVKGSYAYMPITSGGTVFAYNLRINGQRVSNLRLSGTNIAKIYTGVLTTWNDPAIAADNPQLTLPNRKIIPVVRSDGSGSTAQFVLWMISQHPEQWNAYCQTSGRAPACGETSYYPTVAGSAMIAQAGDLGVMGYVSQSLAEGAIGYVNYSYALNANFPVAKMLNSSGYYTEPTPNNVAVSLLKAQINTDPNSDLYLAQRLDDVYTDTDPRTYPLSSYSYLILPTVIGSGSRFSTAKGKSLGAFSYYAMCQGQQESASLGYSPMPINLVQAAFDQIRKIPGVVAQDINIATCKNPTFSPDGSNLLADTAPQPQACDKQGATQCATGTGGLKATTPLVAAGSTVTPGGATGGGGPATGGSTGTNRTGPATGISGTTVTGGSTATTLSPTVAAACADSGACDPGSGPAAQSSGQLASASPTLVKGPSGWTSTQTLMVLAALIVIGLIIAPALTARLLDRREE